MGEMSYRYNCILKCYFDCTLFDFLRGICKFILKCLFPLCPLRLCNGDSAIKYETPLEERKKWGKLRSLEGGVGLTSKMARVPVVLNGSPAILRSPWRADPWRADPGSVLQSVRPSIRRGCASPGGRHGLLCGASPPQP